MHICTMRGKKKRANCYGNVQGRKKKKSDREGGVRIGLKQDTASAGIGVFKGKK